MRLTTVVLSAVIFVIPSIVCAQYDFDDFLQAVESGQSKSSSSSMASPRLAQVPSGPPAAMLDSGLAQPVPMNVPSQAEPLALPAPVQPIPHQNNAQELFQQQDHGLSQPMMTSVHGCQTCGGSSSNRECAAMPYQVPNLPAPSSLRGYFNSPPCVVNVWDGYSCEAAAACAKKQQKLMGTHVRHGKCACGKTHCD